MVRKAQAPRIVMTRMPEGLHARLRKEAKLNRHSVNREIITRLTDSFTQADLKEMIREATNVEAIGEAWKNLSSNAEFIEGAFKKLSSSLEAINEALKKFSQNVEATHRGQS